MGETERGQLIAAIIGAIAVVIAALISVRIPANVPTAILQPTATSTKQSSTSEPTKEPLLTKEPSPTVASPTVASPTVASPTPVSPAPIETPLSIVETACSEWNLASDFQVYPGQKNPNDDSCGNQNVWYFMGSIDRERVPRNYHLLRSFDEAVYGTVGMFRWHDIDAQWSGVYFNAVESNRVWPTRIVGVHPDSSRLIIIGWRSPIQGEIKFSGAATDADSGCGDGINWYVSQNDNEIAAGGFENGGAQDFENGLGGDSLSTISVNVGDYIYLAVDPKRDPHCDSTLVYITISIR